MLGINSSLEKYIYDILNAEYMPNHVAACSNIFNDEEANLRYLGTYFPRSFVEAYNIYEQIFTKPEIDKLYNEKEEIHILVIGGGTGGDLIGLLLLPTSFVQKQTGSFVHLLPELLPTVIIAFHSRLSFYSNLLISLIAVAIVNASVIPNCFDNRSVFQNVSA